jgi:hypothetical protein
MSTPSSTNFSRIDTYMRSSSVARRSLARTSSIRLQVQVQGGAGVGEVACGPCERNSQQSSRPPGGLAQCTARHLRFRSMMTGCDSASRCGWLAGGRNLLVQGQLRLVRWRSYGSGVQCKRGCIICCRCLCCISRLLHEQQSTATSLLCRVVPCVNRLVLEQSQNPTTQT